jgi:RNA polymerase sigma-70 factor (ECF subfamily)
MQAQVRQQGPTAEAIIAAHQRQVWRFLVALGCPTTDADDLTQEVFLNMLRGEFTYESPEATAAWLRSVARNVFFSSLRKRRLPLLAPNADDFEADFGAFEAAAPFDRRVELLRDCIAALDDRLRKAVQLRYGAETSREDMARELGMAEAGVKTLLERLRQKLKECVERKLRADE